MTHPVEPNGLEPASLPDFIRTFRKVQAEVHKAIVGQEQAVEQLLTAFFAGGHVLIEGVPGTGKTTLVKTLGLALNLSFNRIQFTVDLMPADITGTRVILSGADGHREFSFQPGPIFCHLLLGDEINRATPKTQSALLEAMAELQVTSGGTTYPLAPPYFVMATLNPIEMEGTYPLPEAQLDRFLLKVRLAYPNEDDMVRIIAATTGAQESPIEPVFSAATAAREVERLKRLVREVMVAPAVERYAARMVRATQPENSRALGELKSPIHIDAVSRYVLFGSSPRGAQALILCGKVRALLDGRANVDFDDLDELAPAALEHRIMLNYAAHSDNIEPAQIIAEVVKTVRRTRD
ncbi:MAG TPA: MoxR family ATPase [Candidatus Binataceae bacterium]|nr:MoxR family ATPase [Candidatus Binataceae bacterium]